MKTYFELIENTHDEICARERLEWSNFWYDNTNINVENRILLIGDSTVRMVRSTMAEKTGYAVDMLGTSSGLHDIFFQKLVDIFFCSKQYKYKCIFVQLGHHSRINDFGKPYQEEDYTRFEKDYRALIEFLRQYCDNIVLLSIFYSVVPNKKHRNSIQKIVDIFRHYKLEKYDDEINAIKKKKNDVIRKLAQEENLDFCDINDIMKNTATGKFTRFLHIDHIHYENSAKHYIVDQYIPYIENKANS